MPRPLPGAPAREPAAAASLRPPAGRQPDGFGADAASEWLALPFGCRLSGDRRSARMLGGVTD